MARRKSYAQLRAQLFRMSNNYPNSIYTRERFQRVAGATRRYAENMANYTGGDRGATRVGREFVEIPNSANYVEVPRNVYMGLNGG